MERKSPPELRRRVAAAAISYRLGIKSVDYTLKKYVDDDLYDEEEVSLGDLISDHIADSTIIASAELRRLHGAEDIAFGRLGAELTFYKIPSLINSARMLANRGVLLEVFAILRLCVEMISWASVVFGLADDNAIASLKAQTCVTSAKIFYTPAGKLYGYLSKFAHWGHETHPRLLSIEENSIGVITASVVHRAMGLALCILILDFLTEAIKCAYRENANEFIMSVQGTLLSNEETKNHIMFQKVMLYDSLIELTEIANILK